MENAPHRHAIAATSLILPERSHGRGEHHGLPDLPRHHGRRDQIRPPPRAPTPHPAGPPRRTDVHTAARRLRRRPAALPGEPQGLAALAAGDGHGGGGAAAEQGGCQGERGGRREGPVGGGEGGAEEEGVGDGVVGDAGGFL